VLIATHATSSSGWANGDDGILFASFLATLPLEGKPIRHIRVPVFIAITTYVRDFDEKSSVLVGDVLRKALNLELYRSICWNLHSVREFSATEEALERCWCFAALLFFSLRELV